MEQLLLNIGAIMGAIMAVGTFIYKVIITPTKKILQEYKQIKESAEQASRKDVEIIAKIDALGSELRAGIKDLRRENTILFRGTHACLEGLVQMNCNGNVKKCLDEYNEYVQQQFAER